MYKVTEIVKQADVEGKFGPQIRTAFKVEGDDKILSVFSKYPLKIGQEIDGTITTQEKDGRTYYNFQFAKHTHSIGGSPEQFQTVMREIVAIRTLLIKIEAHTNPDKQLSDGSQPPNFDVDFSQDVPF